MPSTIRMQYAGPLLKEKCLGAVATMLLTAVALFPLKLTATAIAVTDPDVALAKKCIFSPESGASLPEDKSTLLDTNRDGVISLEDLNGLGASRAKWKTLFVAPARPADAQGGQPVGSYHNPFVLTESDVESDGGFYDQIRKITFGSDKGSGFNAEVVFLPGTYIKVQLLLRNADISGKSPIKGVIDRFHPVRILMRSLYPLSEDPHKAATFSGVPEGTDAASVLKYGPSQRLKSDGPDGGLPCFLQIQGDIAVPHKSKIAGITVSGLRVINYRNGIGLSYASKIVLKNNDLETLGSARTPEEAALVGDKTTAMYGTSAIGMSRLCENILVKNNHIATTWNRYNSPTPKPGGDPGLMHPFYIINASNVVYLDNKVENSSGPQFKIVDEATYNPDGSIKPSPPFGSQVLINNTFLQSTDRLAGLYPPEYDTLSMIHDNSAQVRFWPDKRIYTKPSPPASYFVFLGNKWETKVPMDFLRRESVTTSTNGISQIPARFPNWQFEGNTWIGFKGGPNIVERRRGVPISMKKDITGEVVHNPDETIRFQPVDQQYPYEQCVEHLRQILKVTSAQDRTLLDIVEQKEIFGVSTDD